MVNTKKNHYYLTLVLVDLLVTFGLVLISFVSFHGFDGFPMHYVSALIYSGSVAVATVVVFAIFGVYRIILRDIGLFESLKMAGLVLAVQVAGIIVVAFVPQLPHFGEYVLTWFLSTAALFFGLPSIRLLFRVLNLAAVALKKKDKIRTLVLGAGATGKIVVDETRRNKDNKNVIIAVVDDDPNKIGGSFSNLPVKGPISDVAKIIDYYQIEEVIIAMSQISQERLHEILGLLDGSPVRVRRMPLISEMAGPNDKKIIDVDLDELLSRDPIKLDNHQVLEMLHGKTVLVTGAGGSIGSELVRQIFRTHPSTFILFDIYENSLYDIQMELVRTMRNEGITDIDLVTLIGSTYNEFRVEQIIKKYHPDYIYHAAAYKHVPLMEDSPAEAIRTNVIGTYNVAKMADKYKVKKMVLVSTDKAVRPTNVMGATKRFAETIIQYFAANSKDTSYAAVRFGNVLGSNGSVVPLFKKQIENGGPITLTDKRIIRYFMTIPEAVSLILQCGLFAQGGEIFILDMGRPVKILHLAEKLIRQAGLIPYVDINIVETGLRPGEKLYEELLLDRSTQTKTENNRIFIEVKEAVKPIEEEIVTISQVFSMEETGDVKKLLAQIIDTYTITENKPKEEPEPKKKTKRSKTGKKTQTKGKPEAKSKSKKKE